MPFTQFSLKKFGFAVQQNLSELSKSQEFIDDLERSTHNFSESPDGINLISFHLRCLWLVVQEHSNQHDLNWFKMFYSFLSNSLLNGFKGVH